MRAPLPLSPSTHASVTYSFLCLSALYLFLTLILTHPPTLQEFPDAPESMCVDAWSAGKFHDSRYYDWYALEPTAYVEYSLAFSHNSYSYPLTLLVL